MRTWLTVTQAAECAGVSLDTSNLRQGGCVSGEDALDGAEVAEESVRERRPNARQSL